jgi:mono/diheme cytochrome c family protein
MWLRRKQRARIVANITLTFGMAVSVSLGQSQSPAKPGLTEDLPAGAMHDKAVTACAECHEARILVQQRLSKAAWTKEVDKMVKWGAVVDPADRDALIDYLSSNFGPERAPYVPPRTSLAEAAPKSRTAH